MYEVDIANTTGLLFFAAMQNNKPPAGQRIAADLRAEIMELADECRRKPLLFRPRRKKGRDQRGHRALVNQRHHGAVEHRDDVGRQYPQADA